MKKCDVCDIEFEKLLELETIKVCKSCEAGLPTDLEAAWVMIARITKQLDNSYGDAWYDGFLEGMKQEDYLDTSEVLKLSEDAEDVRRQSTSD